MPVYSSDIIVNIPIAGTAPYTQAVVNVLNTSDQMINVYMTGQSIDGGAMLFAQNVFTLEPNGVFTQTSEMAAYPAFQFIFYTTTIVGSIDVTLIGPSGAATPLVLQQTPFRRITSEFREITTTPGVGFPALSFQRTSSPPVPQASMATITPQGIDILATDVFLYQIVLGGTLDGEFVDYPTPTTSIPVDQTDLQVNFTATTLTGGQVIFQGMGAGLSGAYATTTVDLFNNGLLANILFEPITLLITSLDQADNMAITFRMLEEW